MNNPFDDYKDKVDYEYIIEAEMEIEYESDDKIYDEQKAEISENIEKGIDELVKDEDYVAESFEEPGLGRVYCRCDEVYDTIKMTFGISKIDAKEPFDVKELIEDIKEFMYCLDSNTDYESGINGITIPGTYPDDDVDDSIELEPANIHFSMKGKKDDIKINVIKKPLDENRLLNIDKELVSEGKISLRNSNDICRYSLNDEGIVEQYLNENLVNSFAFSKSRILNECKDLINEGYLLEDSEPEDIVDFDTEEAQQNLEQGIEQVDKLQQLKDELVNKVDTLMNESKSEVYNNLKNELSKLLDNNASFTKLNNFLEQAADREDITNQEYTELQKIAQDYYRIDESNDITEEFPSTTYTSKVLNSSEVLGLDLENNLNEEQKQWIIKYLGSLDEVKESFIFLTSLIDSQEEILSIDEYVNRLLKSTNI